MGENSATAQDSLPQNNVFLYEAMEGHERFCLVYGWMQPYDFNYRFLFYHWMF